MNKSELKKKLKYILPVLILLIALIIVLIICLLGDKKEARELGSYHLELEYDENNHRLNGKEEVVYVNNSENCFEYLYFHLYPNAFRENAKASVISQVNFDNAYPNGLSFGNIKISKVYNKDSEIEFTIEGEDENILAVKLKNPLFPDEKVSFFIDFEVNLPNINHRFGYGENTVNFGNFYPIACVYEEGIGFSKSLYHSNGDPFYSEVANYDVTISFNSSFDIASSGHLKSSNQNGNIITNTYKAEKIRDFSFVLSENFVVLDEKVDGIDIKYYGYKGDENLSNCLKVSKEAVEFFSESFGKYPYKDLAVVKSNFVHGGMEFPNIVLISDKITNEKDIFYVIVHEIAHQWWYGVVGNDQYHHAWIDEGLSEYSTLLFFEEHSEYGENYNELITNAQNSYILFEEVYKKVTGKVDGRMDRALNEFETEPEYTQCTYTKGVLMFHSFRELVGKNKLIKTLKNLFEQCKFEIADTEDIIVIFEKYGGRETESFFNNWLQGKVILMKS